MFANNNMLFVMLNAKSDALGDLTATTTSTKTFAGAGNAGSHTVGLAVATAFAEGTTAAAPYTDATTDWLGVRRIFNQFAQRQCIVRLAVWADTSLAIDILDGRHDVGSRRCFVGESFRLRTLTIRADRLSPRVCARLDAGQSVSEVFPIRGRASAQAFDTRLRGRLCVCPPAFDESWSSCPSMTPHPVRPPVKLMP